jgi:hypothetical protein
MADPQAVRRAIFSGAPSTIDQLTEAYRARIGGQ